MAGDIAGYMALRAFGGFATSGDSVQQANAFEAELAEMVKTSEDSYSLKMTCRDTEAGAKATLETKTSGSRS